MTIPCCTDKTDITRTSIRPACIFHYNKYMGGVDRTKQLMQPYEIPKYIKWYKKVAMHFNQLALYWLASLCIRRIIKPLLAFEHDIIIYCKSTFWTQKWRSWPAQGGTHCKVHWVTLYRPHPRNRGKAETPKTVQGLLQEGTSQRKSLSVFWLSKQPWALLLTLLWTVPHKTHLHDLICVKITLPLINIAQSERVKQKKVKIFLYYFLLF